MNLAIAVIAHRHITPIEKIAPRATITSAGSLVGFFTSLIV
jgi:hypothetical protein